MAGPRPTRTGWWWWGRPGLESRPGLGSGGSRGVEGPRPTRTGVVVVDPPSVMVGGREPRGFPTPDPPPVIGRSAGHPG